MARTGVFSILRRCARLAWSAEQAGVPTREHLEQLAAQWQISRRELLRHSLGVAAAVPFAGMGCSRILAPRRRSTAARVAVVGAGMAGLHCAFRLAQAGVMAPVFEASGRPGGRMLTARGLLAGGQLTELGAEFIDTNHTCMHALAAELDVELRDMLAGEPPGLRRETYFFAGRIVGEEEIVDAFRPLAAHMAATVARAEAGGEEFNRVDGLSIAEYLDGVPEASRLIKGLISVAYVGEYGLETDEQSALNLLYLIDYAEPDTFRIYGESDERFHARDGNDTLTTRLAAAVENQIETHTRLTAVHRSASGGYRLTFARGGGSLERDFDHVVLAIPFTLLRSIDLAVELPPEKNRVIAELGCGTNAKLVGQFTSRVWQTEHNASGMSFTDNGLQCTWDCTRGQAGSAGALTTFLGGRAGVDIGDGTPEARMLEQLPRIEQLFPGAASAYRSGGALRMHWPSAPFALGSYSCYLPGQWSFHGIEGARAGNLHFCGEQCSLDFQGFMEGACETGALAAAEVLDDLGVPHPDALDRMLRGRLAGEAARSRTLPQPLKRRRGRSISFRARMIQAKAA
jgi:monoamine oxidase